MESADLLSVLLFNISHSSLSNDDKKKGTTGITDDQCTGIGRVIEKTKDEPNLFVFGQDDLAGSKLDTLKGSLSMTTPPGSEPPVAGNKEADILEDRRRGSSALTTSFVDPLSFDPFMYPERLTARKLEFNGQIILLVSWHGPRSRITKDLEIRVFGSLIKYVANMQMKIKADIVILGGDFNITLREAVKAEEKDKVLTSEKLNGKFLPGAGDATFGSSKDFVVVWPKDQVKLVDEYPKILKFNFEKFLEGYQLIQNIDFKTEGGGERKCKLIGPFDHARVLYRLSIESVFSDIEPIRADVDQLTKQMAILNNEIHDLRAIVSSEQK